MPIEVSWGNPQQSVVYTVFGEIWTLEDNHQMIDDMYKLTTSVTHTVHIIMDFTYTKTSPAKLLSAGRHIEKRTVPNSGISVFVNANGFIKAMAQLLTKMFMKEAKLFFANSVEEAYQIIDQREPVGVKS
ncbi:MAG: hypothetical protein ABI690_15400 [Chloroflexota bacterium]